MCKVDAVGRLLVELVTISIEQNRRLAAGADITGLLACEEGLRGQLAGALAGLTTVPEEVLAGLKKYQALKEAGMALAREMQTTTRTLLAEVERARVQAGKMAESRAPARFVDEQR